MYIKNDNAQWPVFLREKIIIESLDYKCIRIIRAILSELQKYNYMIYNGWLYFYIVDIIVIDDGH